MTWLWLSAAAMAATAFFHSRLGEKRMVRPLLALNAGVTTDPRIRRIIRFAWHATSVLMLLSAITVAWPGTPRAVVAIIGGGWLATGLVNAAYLSGRHIVWLFLSTAGALALIGVFA
ncbi:hypothetical protein KNJ79_10010 [Sphingopyxis indica]|uniref:hypothetical protein n=1 Tax=Sphingopyxis indica TaxID=436663 RepID=UPI002938F827|nr:hypothetical protein [Sphingopyxis indica]WOF45175.1 hypothetical protein KNJ79_10010 [Sphingopyxis indica]